MTGPLGFKDREECVQAIKLPDPRDAARKARSAGLQATRLEAPLAGVGAHAAVAGGSLVAFSPSVSAQDRQDIYLCNLFVQLAVRELFETGLVTDWFQEYKKQLTVYGWNATPAPEKIDLAGGSGVAARDAIELIDKGAGPAYSQVASRAFEVLGSNSEAQRIFERGSISGSSGVFQVLPCQQSRSGQVDLALYHKAYTFTEETRGFLFLNTRRTISTLEERVEQVQFKTRYYGQTYRDLIAKRMQKHLQDFFRHLEL
ncbi:hypothetical protein [Pseudomonas sp. R5(2019)]|uniref:hypothetical protein n=1 Tax=Pseudomonas sp. R5(2019) TaxID=2697566 RepID=UPI001411E23E|nr:hypothetical protein [Pseudomonas sp. R5(2019)]NBA95110.1 hypothetical protein [Pseudomonas sp. R5(2019)]